MDGHDGHVGPIGPGLYYNGPLMVNGTLLYYNGTLPNGTFTDEPLYEVPLHVVVLLTFFYVSISVAAIVGNGLVLWVVATSRRMQSVTNCFIANLALADVMIGLFAIPFQVRGLLPLLHRQGLPRPSWPVGLLVHAVPLWGGPPLARGQVLDAAL